MGKIYNIPQFKYGGTIPPDFNWTNTSSLNGVQIAITDYLLADGIVVNDGVNSSGVRYYDTVMSTSNTDYIGFLRRPNGYSICQNYHSNSTHYYAARRTLNNGERNYYHDIVASGIVIPDYVHQLSLLPPYVELYDTEAEIRAALEDVMLYPITYRDTNAVHYGPSEASPGDTVEVSYSFTDGYGIVNPSSDIYVTNNGVLIPSTYADGKLTFTMPDPS